MRKTAIDSIIDDYYKSVLKYCTMHMNGDVHAAEDCTQEVFLILHQKVNSLDMTKDIRPWLYRTADRIMKAHFRKHPEIVGIESDTKVTDESESHESVLDVLTESERMLVDSYYNDVDKQILAKEQGITLPSLYLKIARIKRKLLDELDGLNNNK